MSDLVSDELQEFSCGMGYYEDVVGEKICACDVGTQTVGDCTFLMTKRSSGDDMEVDQKSLQEAGAPPWFLMAHQQLVSTMDSQSKNLNEFKGQVKTEFTKVRDEMAELREKHRILEKVVMDGASNKSQFSTSTGSKMSGGQNTNFSSNDNLEKQLLIKGWESKTPKEARAEDLKKLASMMKQAGDPEVRAFAEYFTTAVRFGRDRNHQVTVAAAHRSHLWQTLKWYAKLNKPVPDGDGKFQKIEDPGSFKILVGRPGYQAVMKLKKDDEWYVKTRANTLTAFQVACRDLKIEGLRAANYDEFCLVAQTELMTFEAEFLSIGEPLEPRVPPARTWNRELMARMWGIQLDAVDTKIKQIEKQVDDNKKKFLEKMNDKERYFG